MGAIDLPSPPSDTGRLAAQMSASEKVRSSDDPEAELAASLLAQRLLLLAVLLAVLLALLHGLRILIAFLLLDLALLVVNEAFAIDFGRRRRRRQRTAQSAGLLALCQLRRVVTLALFGDALFVGVLARRWAWWRRRGRRRRRLAQAAGLLALCQLRRVVTALALSGDALFVSVLARGR